jgi:hypothetical protein
MAGTSALETLEMMGVCNLLLLMVAFRMFCARLFGSGEGFRAGCALLMILLFWGYTPESWSGFLHIYGLHYILPYPSIFAIALSLGVLSVPVSIRKPYRLALICLLSTVVFIVHPNTAIALFIALVVSTPTLDDFDIRNGVAAVLIGIGSVGLSLIWPYFDMPELLFGRNEVFHQQSLILYHDVFEKYWILLLILPAAFMIRFDQVSRFLLASIAIMLLIYWVGYLTGLYGFGRIIAVCMVFFQLYITHVLFEVWKGRVVVDLTFLALWGCLLVTCLRVNREVIDEELELMKSDPIQGYTGLLMLEEFVGERELILSDHTTNWFIPGIRGRVISWNHPLYNVKDQQKRQDDMEAFFDPRVSNREREEILLKYQPAYVLLDSRKAKLRGSAANWLESLGTIVYEAKNLKLISVSRDSDDR